MSRAEANRALVTQALQGFFKDFFQGDSSGQSVIAEDAVWHVPGRHPLAGTYKGRAEVLGVLERARILGADQMAVEIHDVLATDDHVVALETKSATRDGRTYVIKEVLVYHVRGERIAAFWGHPFDQHLVDEFWREASTGDGGPASKGAPDDR